MLRNRHSGNQSGFAWLSIQNLFTLYKASVDARDSGQARMTLTVQESE